MSQLQFGRIHLLLGRLGPHGRQPDPPDRRVLLDQGRLAGLGHRHGRPLAAQHRLRPEHRRLLDRVHLRRRHQGVLRVPADEQHPRRLRHLHPRHQVRRPVLGQTSTPPPSTCSRTSGSRRTTSPGRRPTTPSAPGSTSGTTSSADIRNDRPHNELQAGGLLGPRRRSWAAPPATRARRSPGTR